MYIVNIDTRSLARLLFGCSVSFSVSFYVSFRFTPVPSYLHIYILRNYIGISKS